MFREQRRWGHDPTIVRRTSKATWAQPKKFKPGDKVFICSWSDFWHPAADQWRVEAWHIILDRPDLIWLLLTKRPHEMIADVSPQSLAPANVWFGVTVENQDNFWRLPLLADLSVFGKKFISFEPLVGSIDTHKLNGYFYEGSIDWVIIGCESGSKRRPCELPWVQSLISQADDGRIPVFVKQMSVNGKMTRDPRDWPLWARRRECPQ
jgi:protein gp37